MSAYYATGGPAQRPAGLSPLTPVQVSFAGPAPQSRVTVAFVFGAVISAGYSGYQVTTLARDVGKLAAAAEVTVAAAPARAELGSYPSDVTACDGKLDCVTGLDRTLATDFSTLASELQGISLPSQATAAKARLITASSDVSAAFARLGAATSAGQHASIARWSSGVQQAGEQFDADYDYLVSALRP